MTLLCFLVFTKYSFDKYLGTPDLQLIKVPTMQGKKFKVKCNARLYDDLVHYAVVISGQW